MSDKPQEDKRQQRQTFTLAHRGEPYTITTDGHGNIVEDDPAEFERKMKVARDWMDKHSEVLAALAKS